jgi:hypothetical protein
MLRCCHYADNEWALDDLTIVDALSPMIKLADTTFDGKSVFPDVICEVVLCGEKTLILVYGVLLPL